VTAKIISGIIAAGLLIVFISPVVVKLKDVPLTIVALIGIALMLIDLWQSARSKDD